MQTQLAERNPATETRFGFGENWRRFLEKLNEERIVAATNSLQSLLGGRSLAGKTFLDLGSGSGLSSLVAVRLGASRVHSFDYDQGSVACTRELKRRFSPEAQHWTIEAGSVLDRAYLQSLATWDVVYSWGVLHHSGAMWEAMDNVAPLVGPGGILYIAIYNDQGPTSVVWRRVKSFYNRGPLAKWMILSTLIPYFVLRGVGGDVLRGRDPTRRYRDYQQNRGMSLVHDWLDWLGGFPFEVAKPESVLEFYRSRGFQLERLKTCGGSLGCNEFVFSRP
jgi:2-polyprenyl-3-methyl-5-hydroxy-6-metoxy-1,4-benzoquinol methylase